MLRASAAIALLPSRAMLTQQAQTGQRHLPSSAKHATSPTALSTASTASTGRQTLYQTHRLQHRQPQISTVSRSEHSPKKKTLTISSKSFSQQATKTLLSLNPRSNILPLWEFSRLSQGLYIFSFIISFFS